MHCPTSSRRGIADRVEIRFEEAKTEELAAAALAEGPIYRGGEQLQPWQRSFVTMFLQHREIYGKARLLLADEVGVGKTLSLAASAMVSALLDDGPVLILCPSTLTIQWQIELMDKLGIPSAVWSSQKKVWADPKGHIIKTRGPEDIVLCPFRIAIVHKHPHAPATVGTAAMEPTALNERSISFDAVDLGTCESVWSL